MIPEDIEILHIGNEDNLEEMILAALLETWKIQIEKRNQTSGQTGGC